MDVAGSVEREDFQPEAGTQMTVELPDADRAVAEVDQFK